MFFDWLTIEQDFGFNLPLVSDTAYQYIDIESGQIKGRDSCLYQLPFVHRGSFCDSVGIRIRGSLLTVSGNPSRWGRVENLFGLPAVDACVSVFNTILNSIGLPSFTKCTRIFYSQSPSAKVQHFSDGAVIKELHITSNRAVGFDNVLYYISALSSQPYRNSVPRLHTNGRSADWLSKNGSANLIYPSVYDKAHELELHSLNKIKNKFGSESDEFIFLNRVIDYCREYGVVRFEQKLKSRFLKKNRLSYWGLSDYSILKDLQYNFISVDKNISVSGMDINNISSVLLNKGVVKTTRAANVTALYALEWMHGKVFDFNKRSIQTHRARLRKIGIDIAQKCDISKFTPVIINNIREITVTDLSVPQWYIRPCHLRRVA